MSSRTREASSESIFAGPRLSGTNPPMSFEGFATVALADLTEEAERLPSAVAGLMVEGSFGM